MQSDVHRREGKVASAVTAQAVRDPLTGLGREAAWTVLQLLAAAVAQVAVASIAVRRMGSAEFGEAALVVAIATLISVVDVGFGTVIVRCVAAMGARSQDESPQELQRQIAATVGLCVVTAAFVALVTTAGMAVAARWGRVDIVTVSVAGAAAAVYVLGTPFAAVAAGQRAFRTIALAAICGAFANLMVVLALSSFGSVAVAAGFLAGVGVQRVALIPRLFRTVRVGDLRPRARGSDVWRVLRFAGPLLATAALSQLVITTDLLTLSIMSGVAVVGRYRIGSSVTAWGAGALFRVFDVAFPALVQAGSRAAQDEALRLLGRVFCLMAGAGFGVLFAERDTAAQLLYGQRDSLVSDVIGVLAITWALNVPAHGLVLILTARSQHGFLPALVGIETIVNIGLTVMLVSIVGPIGAAWSTLATLAISNLLALPMFVRTRYPTVWSLLYRHGLLMVGYGLLLAASVSTAAEKFLSGGATVASTVVVVVVGVSIIGRMTTTSSERSRLRTLFFHRPKGVSEGHACIGH